MGPAYTWIQAGWVALHLWEAWGGRMASDASWKRSSFIPSHHACSNFLKRELMDRQSCYSIILQSQLHRQKDYSRQPIIHHTPREDQGLTMNLGNDLKRPTGPFLNRAEGRHRAKTVLILPDWRTASRGFPGATPCYRDKGPRRRVTSTFSADQKPETKAARCQDQGAAFPEKGVNIFSPSISYKWIWD